MKLTNDISQLFDGLIVFFQQHEAALAIMSAWAAREWQHAKPAIQSAYPWLKKEGGIKGVIHNIFNGSSSQSTVQPVITVQQNKLV